MRTWIFFIFNLAGVAVWAGSPPTSFNYQGRLLTSGGTAVTSSSITFTISILSHDGTCTLYQETHNKDLSSSNGFFSLNIGSGTNTGATALTILQVFDNTAVAKSGASCSYTPSSGDYRQLNVKYDEGSGQVTLTPNHIILSTPNAMVAQTLQGITADGFVQVQGNVTQNKLDDLASKHTELMALANGTSSTYTKSNELVGASVPTVANGESLRWNTALNGGSGGWEAFTPGSASAVLTVSSTAPIVAGGTATNPVLSISAATTSAAGSMSSSDKSKLDGVETGATADQSAAEILTALLTVDGTGTGLDADLIDGTELSAIPLLSGRSGGQTLVGGTGASENLVLDSTSNGTKGNVVLNPTSGSVGIGTSSPASVLDVAGRVSITGTNGSASNPQLRLLGTNAGDTNTGFFKPTDDTIGVATSGTERVRVDSSGNVGIGTGSPGQKLTVAGTIESTSGGIKFPDGTTQTTAAGGTPALNIEAKTANYTVVTGDSGKTILASAGSDLTMTLPALSGVSSGFYLRVKNTGINTVSLTGSGSDNIEEYSDLQLLSKYSTVEVFSDGSSWFIGNTWGAISQGFATVSTSAGQWTGSTSSFTFGTGTIVQNSNDKYMKTNDTFAGDFNLTFKVSNGGFPTIGVYPTSSDGSFSTTSGATSISGAFYLYYASSGLYREGSSTASGSPTGFVAEGTIFRLERSGSTLRWYKDGVLHFTHPTTSSATMRIFHGTNQGTPELGDIENVSWGD